MVAYREVPEHDDDGCNMEEVRGGSNSEASVQILPTKRSDLGASKEANQHPTAGGGKEGGPVGFIDRIS